MMSETILRLRNFRNYMDDGKSWVEKKHGDQNKVFVVVLVGEEPKRITDSTQCCDVDAVILRMAAHIREQRRTNDMLNGFKGIRL